VVQKFTRKGSRIQVIGKKVRKRTDSIWSMKLTMERKKNEKRWSKEGPSVMQQDRDRQKGCKTYTVSLVSVPSTGRGGFEGKVFFELTGGLD